MAKIQSKIHREKLPRTLGYPLRFSDIERCLTAFTTETVHLWVSFHRLASIFKSKRDYATNAHLHRTVELSVQRDPPFNSHVHSMCRSNESDVIEIGVVGTVFGVPRTELRDAGYRREHLAEFLKDQTERLASEQHDLSRCDVTIHLDVAAKRFECVREYWRHDVKERKIVEHRDL